MSDINGEFHVKISIKISNFSSSSKEIGKLLGIQPTHDFSKGDLKKHQPNSYHEESFWSVSVVDSPGHEEVIDEFKALKNILEGKVQNFKKLPKYSNVTIAVSIYPWEYIPCISIPKYISEMAAEINAVIEVNIANISSN